MIEVRNELSGCKTAINHFFDRYEDKYGIILKEPLVSEPSEDENFQVPATAPALDSSRATPVNIPDKFSNITVNNLYISVNRYPVAGTIFAWMLASYVNDSRPSKHDYTHVTKENDEDNEIAETVAKVAVGACAVVVLVTAFFVGGFLVRDVSEALKVKREIRKIEKTLNRQISSYQKEVESIDKRAENYFKALDEFNLSNPNGTDPNDSILSEQKIKNEEKLDADASLKKDLNPAITSMQDLRNIVAIHKQYHNVVLKKRVTYLATLVAGVAGVVLLAVGVIVPYTALIVAGAVVLVAAACFGGAFFTFHIGDGKRMKAEVNNTSEQAQELFNWVHGNEVNKTA